MGITNIVKSFARTNRRYARAIEKLVPPFFSGSSYHDVLLRRVQEDLRAVLRQPVRVLEIGGIDRPVLGRQPALQYDGVDIESKEICQKIYDHFYVQSIENPLPNAYHMIISKTLLEHVPDNDVSMENIFEALEPGGSTHHYLPSKWHPYSIALRLVGPAWQKRLISLLRSDSQAVTGYPAYFHRCSLAEMKALLKRVGFSDIKSRTLYRANDYFAFFVPLFISVTALENLCRHLGWDTFASGFVISARKPKS